MEKHQELVSIIVPCYNHAQFLAEAVESVIAQSYQNWECIIVDDGSNDHTGQVSETFVKSDKRIHYLKKANGGLSSARNYGVQHAVGTYILPLDADDKIHSHYLEAALVAFANDPRVKVVYCDAELFEGKTGKWTLPPFTLRQLARENMIFCSAVYRKVDWVKAGGYDEQLKFGSEDWEFWINILKDGGDVVKLPFVGFFYRIRPESMLRSLDQNKLKEIGNYICKKHFDFVVRELGNPINLSFEIDYLKRESGQNAIILQKLRSKFIYRVLHKLKVI
ncbi:glycosyltransferase family 2 protein [Flavitalea antarctica]